MMDRDKVIKALECCTKKICIYKDTEKECPYWELCGEYEDAFEDCTTALAKDAIALLKAQEPVKPKWQKGYAYCGKCGYKLHWIVDQNNFCPNCGQEVKWK